MNTVKPTVKPTANKTNFALIILPYKIKLHTFELVDSDLCQYLQGSKEQVIEEAEYFASCMSPDKMRVFVYVVETFGEQGGKTLVKPFKAYNIPTASEKGTVVAQLLSPKETILKELSSIEKQMTRLLAKREHLEALLSRLT